MLGAPGAANMEMSAVEQEATTVAPGITGDKKRTERNKGHRDSNGTRTLRTCQVSPAGVNSSETPGTVQLQGPTAADPQARPPTRTLGSPRADAEGGSPFRGSLELPEHSQRWDTGARLGRE